MSDRPKKLTPMLQQYYDIKDEYPDCILFFRMGDFYEMFGNDAKEASHILEITLTARQKGGENEVPMCGVPHHSSAQYITKLTKAGKKVAMCEQISDPKLPGLVQRGVVRVITPGTTLDENILDNRSNNFLVGVYRLKKMFGVAALDITTGEFFASQYLSWAEVMRTLQRFEPQEVIIGDDLFMNDDYRSPLEEFGIVNNFTLNKYQIPEELLCEQFGVRNLEGFGLAGLPAAISAAGTVLGYMREMQKNDSMHVQSIAVIRQDDYMTLDAVTLRNLDVLYNSYTHTREHSLLAVLDHTITSAGARLLRQWLIQPLNKREHIETRLQRVRFFVEHTAIRGELRQVFKQIADMHRLIGRIGCGRTHGRDMVLLRRSLEMIPAIRSIFASTEHEHLQAMIDQLDACDDLINLIERAFVDEPPLTITEGGMIRAGYNPELDELLTISHSGKDYIKNLQAQEIEKTGITSLKVKFNKVFGYYIEVSKSYTDKVPEHYVRKQTLVNAERYIIPELKEYEQKILTAEDRIKDIEYQLFQEIVVQVQPFIERIQKNAHIIAELDVLSTFAHNAVLQRYCEPTFNDDGRIDIKQGRHPVIEQSDIVDDYIPNDVQLDHDDHQLLLLTGPNMAGKSSYLRQVALITLLAHLGSFVPAHAADIALVDRIFTRVGASDNLSRGQSTFMVEMQEAANILHNATERSLIILDEIGRGTSTYDGLSIAWAIVEYIYQAVGAKTLFATHYHELIHVVQELPKGQNYAMAVKEFEDGVVFLHQVVFGGCDQSYGIEVAKLAGMPGSVVQSARSFLQALEKKQQNAVQPSLFDAPVAQYTAETVKLERKIEQLQAQLAEIESLEVNEMTPIETLTFLSQYKKRITSHDA